MKRRRKTKRISCSIAVAVIWLLFEILANTMNAPLLMIKSGFARLVWIGGRRIDFFFQYK